MQRHFGDSTRYILDDLGYAGIKASPKEIRIFDPKDMKIQGVKEVQSKSQLTDIWNKAQETPADLRANLDEAVAVAPKPEQLSMQPDIGKLKETKTALSDEKKSYLNDFKATEEGSQIYAKAQVDVENKIDFDGSIVSGVKANPFYKAEGAIHDQMGEGWVLTKGDRTAVIEPDRVQEYIDKGWAKSVEVDSLAKEAGFDNGNDYLQYQMALSEKNGNLTTPEKALHNQLYKTDPYYKSVSDQVDNLKAQLKEYDKAEITEKTDASPKTAKSNPETPPAKEEVRTDGLKTSGVAKSIEAKAVEQGLIKQGFDKTAGYDPITIKDQSERAANLLNSGIDNARAVIRGDKPLPDGLKGTALITAMEEHLKANPNADIAYELANSPLTTKISEAAQEMRLAGEREPDSATAKLQEIKKNLEDNAKKTNKVKDVNKLKDTTTKKLVDATKILPKEEASWEKFLSSIAC
jgi:hypothetical protein